MSLCDPRSPKVLLPSSLINLFLCRRIHRFLSACETVDSINPFIGTYFTRHGLICLQAVHRLCDFVNDTFVCPPQYRILHLFSSITAHMLHQSAQENKVTKNVNCHSRGRVAWLCTVSLTPHTNETSRLAGTFVSGICLCSLACLVFLWVLHLFPHSPKTCMFGEFVGCTVGGDVRVCVCLSVLALWWLGTTVYPVFCLLTDGIDCRYPMT